MTQSIETILVPTDGSDTAETGAQRGIDLAITLGADLHIISVIDTQEIDSLSRLQSEERIEHEELLAEEAGRAVDPLADAATSQLSGRVRTAVERGVPYRTISEYADSNDIDLIVMGTHGRTGLERVLLGSVAEKTLRTAKTPILLVPPEADIVELGERTYEDILLPTDGSEGAEIAGEWAISLAEVYEARVHSVYSVDTSHFGGYGGIAGIYDILEETGEEALESVREHARAAGVTVNGVIANGSPARIILSYVEDHDIDLLVMGTHGRGGIERHLVGSITETVVRKSPIPVWCVPMDETGS